MKLNFKSFNAQNTSMNMYIINDTYTQGFSSFLYTNIDVLIKWLFKEWRYDIFNSLVYKAPAPSHKIYFFNLQFLITMWILHTFSDMT